jgi:hypothetical protein
MRILIPFAFLALSLGSLSDRTPHFAASHARAR